MRIRGIGTALPVGAIDQQRAATLGAALAGGQESRRRRLGALYRRSGVERRHSVLVSADDDRPQSFYAPPERPGDRGPGTAERMHEYGRHALPLAAEACTAALADAALPAAAVTHLITVSCTGFHAPGVDVGLVGALQLPPSVRRAHVGFMGCHGLFNALALAAPITAADPEARVLVCAVELCSLHYNYSWDSEKIVANALFADGAAALIAQRETPSSGASLHVLAHGTALLPDCLEAMTWGIGDHGFEMTLSPRVPALIREHSGAWLEGWLPSQGLRCADIGSWAVHPGGPRILGAFEDSLGLPDGALELSRAVLATHGNMSSATIGFILERVRTEARPDPVVAVGFGPGLTIEAFAFVRD